MSNKTYDSYEMKVDRLVKEKLKLQKDNEECRKQLASEIKEREGLYPVIDEKNRMREVLEKEIEKLKAECRKLKEVV
jgi:predicted nuclease with TOPRIM domain